MTDLKPDIDAAIRFLEQWQPGGTWVLTFLNPAGRGVTTVAHDDPARVRSAIAYYNEGRRWNCYWQVNPDRRAPTTIRSKSAKADIAAAVALHADIDPYKGEDAEAGRQRILAALGAARPGPPTVIILSGNGFNVAWKLREQVVMSGNPEVEMIEARNRWLAAQLGGDSTTDVCRIMRIPGSVNYPNATKRARGLVPVMSRLMLFEPERLYELEAFPALANRHHVVTDWQAVEIVQPDDDEIASLPPRLREILDDGRVEGETLPGDDSGSGWAFHLAGGLVDLGWSVGKVAGALLGSAWLLSKDQSVDVERQAVRTAVRAAARRETVDPYEDAEVIDETDRYDNAEVIDETDRYDNAEVIDD